MRELREDTFSRNKEEDAHYHIDRVPSIVALFNILGVSKDAVMLRAFTFTLIGAAKRWVGRLALGIINTWDLLKKTFIQRDLSPGLDQLKLSQQLKPWLTTLRNGTTTQQAGISKAVVAMMD
ncbi:hypothetical protein Tco_1313908 [Tanacetum coccineum]